MMFASNWVWSDAIRTLLDRTATRGVLAVQDDIGPMLAEELPYDRLVRLARENGLDVLDYRQVPRTGRGKAHGTRKIENVTALWWHQMAAAIEDPERCLGIPAHGAVTRWGSIVLLHPIRAYMYHGHAANKFSIGIELAVRACGIEGDSRTLWMSRKEKSKGVRPESLVSELSPAQEIAANLLADYYVGETARQCVLADVEGGIVASGDHRFSHSSRISDPGSRAHQRCTVAVAERHGLEVGPVIGSGKPNPTIWSGPPGVPYSWRVRGY